MGYPMTWSRVISRSNLFGDYTSRVSTLPGGGTAERDNDNLSFLCGDIRRFEVDQRDQSHLEHYARLAGIATYQVKAVLDALFDGAY